MQWVDEEGSDVEVEAGIMARLLGADLSHAGILFTPIASHSAAQQAGGTRYQWLAWPSHADGNIPTC